MLSRNQSQGNFLVKMFLWLSMLGLGLSLLVGMKQDGLLTKARDLADWLRMPIKKIETTIRIYYPDPTAVDIILQESAVQDALHDDAVLNKLSGVTGMSQEQIKDLLQQRQKPATDMKDFFPEKSKRTIKQEWMPHILGTMTLCMILSFISSMCLTFGVILRMIEARLDYEHPVRIFYQLLYDWLFHLPPLCLEASLCLWIYDHYSLEPLVNAHYWMLLLFSHSLLILWLLGRRHSMES